MIAARLTVGAISVSNSSNLPGKFAFCVDEAGDIAARTGQAGNKTLAHRIGDGNKYDRDRPRFLLESSGHWCRVCEDSVGC
jgi:hypothetical protein